VIKFVLLWSHERGGIDAYRCYFAKVIVEKSMKMPILAGVSKTGWLTLMPRLTLGPWHSQRSSTCAYFVMSEWDMASLVLYMVHSQNSLSWPYWTVLFATAIYSQAGCPPVPTVKQRPESNVNMGPLEASLIMLHPPWKRSSCAIRFWGQPRHFPVVLKVLDIW